VAENSFKKEAMSLSSHVVLLPGVQLPPSYPRASHYHQFSARPGFVKPFVIYRTDSQLLRLRWAQVETLCFIKRMFSKETGSQLCLQHLGLFSCTFCILKPFIGVQYSLHKGKKSQQFRLLVSFSAEIINGNRLTVSLKTVF
jgi:hypothetical protein